MLNEVRKRLEDIVSYNRVSARRLAIAIISIPYLATYSIAAAKGESESPKHTRSIDYEAIVERVKSSTDSVIVRILEGEVSDPIGSNELWWGTERELAAIHVIKSPYFQGSGGQGYINITVVHYKDGDILLTRFWGSKFTKNRWLEEGYVKGDVEENLVIVDGGEYTIDGVPENVYVEGEIIRGGIFSRIPPRLLEGYPSNPEIKNDIIQEYQRALDDIRFFESKKEK